MSFLVTVWAFSPMDADIIRHIIVKTLIVFITYALLTPKHLMNNNRYFILILPLISRVTVRIIYRCFI